MAITITDNRVSVGLIDRGDSDTGWTSPVGGGSPTLYTADPVPKELTGHVGLVTSNEEMDMLHTHGSGANLSSGVLVYIWAANYGIQDTAANYGVAAILGDGTNTNAYQVAGLDKAVFRHAEGAAVNYQCVLVDTGSLPSGKAVRGTFASFDDTAVTEYGILFATTLKSVGGVENCFIDQILYGNGGLTIVGTETTTLLDDVSVIDASDTSDTSYGIVRDNGGGIFGIQGQLLMGDTSSGTDTLSIQDQTLAFENFTGVGTDKFGLTFQGGSGTQTFVINNSSLFCPAGTGAFFTATDTDVESLDITNSNILNFDQGITFTTDATNGPNHDISNNKFVGCSQIDVGKTAFADNIIDSTTDANGGMLISSTTSLTNVSGLSFFSDGTGHSIYITATGTYDFTNFTYTGYGASGTTDACVYNNSGGLVTINVLGGDTPTVRNGASASTIVNSSVSLTITVKDESTTVIENASVGIYRTTNSIMQGAVADDGGSQTDETTAANNATTNDMTLLPSGAVAVDDAYYFGSTDRFWQLEIDIGQSGSGAWVVDWEYYNGSWTSLSTYGLYDGTDGFKAGTGTKYVRFDPQSNWTTTSVQSISAYWVRAVVTTGDASPTTQPLGTRSYTWSQLMNELTNASGIATESYNDPGGGIPISIRVRKSTTGTTRYYPVSTTGSIGGDFNLEVVMTQDSIVST